MIHFLSIKRVQFKLLPCLILLLVLCSGIFSPTKSWAQAFFDTGTFYFTGTHNPFRRSVFRQFLPGDGLRAGPAQVHPFLGIAEVFTDNAFRRNRRRRSDFLTTIAPGMQVNIPFGGRHSFLIDYRLAQFLYRKFSKNNALAQDGSGRFRFNFPNGWRVDLQGGHVEGFDNRGSELDTQQDDITKWNTNSFLGQAEFLGSNLGVRFRMNYRDIHYKNNDQAAPRDRNTLGSSLAVFIPATENISGQLAVRISKQTFDKNKQLDSFSYGLFTGFRLRGNRLLTGEFSIGYTIFNFDRAPETDPVRVMELEQQGLSVGGKQQKLITMTGRIFWRPTTQLSFGLRPFRRIRQSAVFNTSTFTQTGISLFGRKQWNTRIAARSSFFYSRNAFDGRRRDNRFRWRVGGDYKTVQWLGFRLDYIFEKRSSNLTRFNNYANTIMISVQALL